MIKYKEKNYRLDLNKWEQKVLIFSIITAYIYSIRKEGKLKKSYSFCKKSPKTEDVFFFSEQKKIQVGRDEFKEKYKGNRWIVPLNRELNLTMP